ncbi:hypothetical protein HYY70_02660 [Candidatus Woesearchaeota archaeon]|nr:hypothetical protein [Candidatus Woesearchaeota archaeon]
MNLKHKLHLSTKNIAIGLLVSIAVFIALYYLTFYFTTPRALRSMEGSFYLYFTFVSNIIITILFGLNVSILVHRLRMKTKIAKESSLSGSGVLAGAFASGCPVCGSLLLPLIGISGGLAAFPFRGLELKALAMSLMILSTYFVLKGNNKCDNCEDTKAKH